MMKSRNFFSISCMIFLVMMITPGFILMNQAQTTLLSESFENGGSIPANWALETVVYGNAVTFTSSSFKPSGFTAYNGTYMVMFNSYNASDGVMRLKKTLPVSTVGYSNVAVDFAWLESTGYAGVLDKVDVQWSTNGITWNTAGTFNRYNIVEGWKIKSQTLPPAANGVANLYIAFLFTSYYGNNCYLDFAHITGIALPSPVTITVGAGTVDCNYPYGTYYRGGRTQLLYTAAQLTASGATTGQITSLGFNVNSYSAQAMQNFHINMMNTSAATLPGWVSGMQGCYAGTYAVPGTGWQMITLQTPFVWTGENIVLEICYGDNPGYTSYSYVYGTDAPAGQIRSFFADNLTGCTHAGGYFIGNTGLPNLRFSEVQDAGHLTGTVTSCYNNTPVSGVTVTCGTSVTTTNASGVYSLYNIPIGTYNVTYTLAGYFPGNNSGTVIANGLATTKNICLNPVPAYLTGVVTSAATGNPIIGATISAGGSSTLSTGPNGAYVLNVYPVGTFSATCSKAGFVTSTTGPHTFTQAITTVQNYALLENLNPPNTITAALNGGQTAVNISWNAPYGNIELLYDDGIQEDFQIWTFAGSYNAVKFTPTGYPCTLNGGKINIGSQASYPLGSNPLVPFQFLVFDALGIGGVPGSQIAGPFDFTPTSYGWNSFTLPIPVTIPGGSFYIVQVQGGNNPNAAGIAIDATSNQLKSYIRNMPSPTWVNVSGNFMMRAMMYGPGGPAPLMMLNPAGDSTGTGAEFKNLSGKGSIKSAENKGRSIDNDPPDNTDNPAIVTGYQVWRLLQGQEGTPAAWTSIGTPSAQGIVDNSWPALPCNPYRWAVETQYTGNRWSGPAFSNVLGKCWIAAVTVNAGLSCAGESPIYANVRLQNTVYVDTIYQATLGNDGTCTFPQVWKGTYNLTVTKFGYTTYIQSGITIMGNTTLNVTLLQIKTPPYNLLVNNQSLIASWRPPETNVTLFSENWSSGSFATNGWTTSGGTNWQISATYGNPLPSAMFYYFPVVYNYDQYLTSKDLTGLHSTIMTLKYDIYLYNNTAPNTNYLSVEIWNGSSWDVLKTYPNAAGFPWTSETLNISAYTHNTFKIRFHTAGNNSDNINNWNIDNISIVASGAHPDPCLLGYSFYINSGLAAILNDTTYTIPAAAGNYGQALNCCVRAMYGSGSSDQVCSVIVSHFLCPPTGLNATDIGTTAYLSWTKPLCPGAMSKSSAPSGQGIENTGTNPDNPSTAAGLLGYNIYRSAGSSAGPWILIQQLLNPNTLNTSDLSLLSGEYWYQVTGYYELSPLGLPGFDESLPAGPEPAYILMVPDNRSIRNKTIANGQSECYDATQVITIAGNNSSYTIQSGGSITMIAGQKISYLPTTTVHSGGYLHGSITASAAYCTSKAPSLVSVQEADPTVPSNERSSLFKVYPNPTRGIFILELNDASVAGNAELEIYNGMGAKILVKSLTSERKYELSLASMPAGVYVVRIMADGVSESMKIIKQ